ncbi:MAG TPA: PIG-L family deacetylase, partial [bacterium]|nr:PIG-L family deacetylase [bacterium]
EMKRKYYTPDQIKKRKKIIKQIAKLYKFSGLIELKFSTGNLDKYLLKDLIEEIKKNILDIVAEIIYIPFYGDIHSDHRICFEAAMSATKNFRLPFIKKIYMYETLSETNFSFINNFSSIVFNNITNYFDRKIEILNIYKDEFSEHPFPRSFKSVEALAILRGSQAGYKYAEAFQLIKERVD